MVAALWRLVIRSAERGGNILIIQQAPPPVLTSGQISRTRVAPLGSRSRAVETSRKRALSIPFANILHARIALELNRNYHCQFSIPHCTVAAHQRTILFKISTDRSGSSRLFRTPSLILQHHSQYSVAIETNGKDKVEKSSSRTLMYCRRLWRSLRFFMHLPYNQTRISLPTQNGYSTHTLSASASISQPRMHAWLRSFGTMPAYPESMPHSRSRFYQFFIRESTQTSIQIYIFIRIQQSSERMTFFRPRLTRFLPMEVKVVLFMLHYVIRTSAWYGVKKAALDRGLTEDKNVVLSLDRVPFLNTILSSR